MKIGIIIHSRTGHRYSVAQRLEEKLSADGHTVDIHQLRLAGGQDAPGKDSKIENPPDLSGMIGLYLGLQYMHFLFQK